MRAVRVNCVGGTGRGHAPQHASPPTPTAPLRRVVETPGPIPSPRLGPGAGARRRGNVGRDIALRTGDTAGRADARRCTLREMSTKESTHRGVTFAFDLIWPPGQGRVDQVGLPSRDQMPMLRQLETEVRGCVPPPVHATEGTGRPCVTCAAGGGPGVVIGAISCRGGHGSRRHRCQSRVHRHAAQSQSWCSRLRRVRGRRSRTSKAASSADVRFMTRISPGRPLSSP